MTQQLIVRLDTKIKNKLAKIARAEGKNTSGVVRELIQEYIANRDMASYVDDLWDRIGGQLDAAGVDEQKIAETIRTVRDKS